MNAKKIIVVSMPEEAGELGEHIGTAGVIQKDLFLLKGNVMYTSPLSSPLNLQEQLHVLPLILR